MYCEADINVKKVKKCFLNQLQVFPYQNKSCHSERVTVSWRRSLRTVGLIEGHLSSNCNCPCAWKEKKMLIIINIGKIDEVD